MSERELTSGHVYSVVLDGRGGARELDADGLRVWKPEDGPLWVHLDLSDDSSAEWLRSRSGLDPITCDALVADQARPRAITMGGGLMVILRGMNFNPGAEPHDMVVLRAWLEPNRIITIRRRRLMTPSDLYERLKAGTGPRDAAHFLVELCDEITERMSPVIDEIAQVADDLEEAVVNQSRSDVRAQLGAIRLQAISIRRYLTPQRDAMARLAVETVEWIGPRERAAIREVSDRVLRYIEDIDEARDRILVAQDQINYDMSERLNRNMYRLAVAAAIFLPLTLLTGLLGINVGGIPGAETAWAFWGVCILCVVIGVMLLWFFKRSDWL